MKILDLEAVQRISNMNEDDKEPVEINYSVLPNTSLVPFAFYRAEAADEWLRTYIGRAVTEARIYSGRPLSQHEAESIAYHNANLVARAHLIARDVGLSTAYLIWAGRKTYRFPFYTPSPGGFLHPGYFDLSAHMKTHALRASAYTSVGLLFVLFGMRRVIKAGQLEFGCDGRLESFWADVKLHKPKLAGVIED